MHLLLQRLFFLLQPAGGAGIYVEHGGEATLTNSSVYENEVAAGNVLLLHFKPSQTVPPVTCLTVTCTHGWQGGGGGLYIDGTATLINTNVYANMGDGRRCCWVCSSLEPSSSAGWHSRTLTPPGRRTSCEWRWHSNSDQLRHL